MTGFSDELSGSNALSIMESFPNNPPNSGVVVVAATAAAVAEIVVINAVPELSGLVRARGTIPGLVIQFSKQ